MVKISFVLLTAVMAIVLMGGINRAAIRALAPAQKKRLILKLTFLLAGWVFYVTGISLAGVLQTASLPPRIPLLLILPLLAGMLYGVRTETFRKLLAATPPHWLVYPQVFRTGVELLLLALYKEGLVPRAGTFEGYNYEIVIAILALAIGYIAQKKKRTLYPMITVWNIGGLLTLGAVVFIMISHAYFPGIYANPEKLSVKDFGSFPFTLLAGFLMPLAVFLHICSLLKQKQING